MRLRNMDYKQIIIFILVFWTIERGHSRNYRHAKVFKLNSGEDEHEILKEFRGKIDFWTNLEIRGDVINVTVASDVVDYFSKYLEKANLNYRIDKKLTSGGKTYFQLSPRTNLLDIVNTFGRKLDFWTPLRMQNKPIVFLVNDRDKIEFSEYLKDHKIDFTIDSRTTSFRLKPPIDMMQLIKEPKVLQFSLLIREDDGPATLEISDPSDATNMSEDLKSLSIPFLMQTVEHPGVTKFEIEPTQYLRDLSNIFGKSIDFWTTLNKDERFTKFYVDSKTQGRFIRFLRSNNIEYTTVVTSGDEGILEFRFEPGLNYSKILETFGGSLDYWTPLVKDGEPITILVKAEAVSDLTEFLKAKKVFFNRINTYEPPKKTTMFFLHMKYLPQLVIGQLFEYMINKRSIKYIEKEPIEFIFRHELGGAIADILRVKGIWYSIEEWPTEFKVTTKIDRAMRIRDIGRIFGNDVAIWGQRFAQTDSVKVMVSANVGNEFINYLKKYKIPFKEIVPDVEELLESRSKTSDTYKFNKKNGPIDFSRYEKYDTIVEHLYDLAVKYPNVISVDNLGLSTEGKEIVVAKLSISKDDSNKPVVLIDAGIHAREWIGPAAALFIIKQLAEVTLNLRLLKYMDWYIIPVLNPDGYEFSRVKDRLWRKNRKRNPNSTCFGVDLNRNFGFHWSNTLNDPCSESYPGPKAFSEVETSNFRDYVSSLGNRIKLYVSLHSYGNMILYPWGYTESSPQNVDSLQQLGEEVSKKIRDYNQDSSYKVGRISEMLYKATGCSVDWMKGTMGVDYAYAIEIFDGESQGEFEPGPQHILKCVHEVFAGMKVFNYYIEKKFVKNVDEIIVETTKKTRTTTKIIVTTTEKEAVDPDFWSSWFD